MTNKYARQISLDGFGEAGQDRLSRACVGLVGVGGVGSAVLPLLAGAGVGRIKIIDCDVVAAHNLHRQTLYAQSQVGAGKAELAAARATQLNPDIRAEFFNLRLDDAESASKLFADCDLCIDATDSFSARILVSKACELAGICEIMASAEGYVSQVFFFGGSFYAGAVIGDSDAASERAAGRAIFPPSAHFSGVLAASAGLRHLSGVEKIKIGKMISFNHATQKMLNLDLL